MLERKGVVEEIEEGCGKGDGGGVGAWDISQSVTIGFFAGDSDSATTCNDQKAAFTRELGLGEALARLGIPGFQKV